MTSKIMFEYANCALCGEDDTTFLFAGKDRLHHKEGLFNVVKCKHCGLIYTNPRPTKETIGYFYPSDYYTYQEPTWQTTEIISKNKGWFAQLKNEIKCQVLELFYGYDKFKNFSKIVFFKRMPVFIKKIILLPFLLYFKNIHYRIPGYSQNGKVLDIGCGNGAYLLLLKKMGWDVIGVDINDNISQEVKKAKISAFTNELEELEFEENSFDLITLWHVLEHLHDPLKTLNIVRRLLKNDGILSIEVPNSSSVMAKLFKSAWFAWELPRHLCHFSPNSLSMMLNQAGFKITEIRYLSKNTLGKSIEYWLENLGIKCDIDLIEGKWFFSCFLKHCGILLAFFQTSNIIFVEAKKE